MSLTSFSTLTMLAALYGVLTLWETSMYRKLDEAQAEQAMLQTRVAYLQQMDSFIEQVVRRMAQDSVRDHGISDILKRNKINVVVTDTGGVPGAIPPANTVTNPNPSDPPATNSGPLPPSVAPIHP